jgi:hypothetical protein
MIPAPGSIPVILYSTASPTDAVLLFDSAVPLLSSPPLHAAKANEVLMLMLPLKIL